MIFNCEHYAISGEKDSALIKALFEKITAWTIESETKLNLNNITINQSIAYDVIRKSYEDMLRYRKSFNPYNNIEMPDHYKEAAHLAYWIRRLRPFGFDPDPTHPVNLDYQKEFIRWINEQLALHFMEFLCITGEKLHSNTPKSQKFPHNLKKDFLHMFRYKHVSPHALMLILRSTF